MFTTVRRAAEICDAVHVLASEARDGWSGDALSAELLDLLAASERLQAEIVRLAGQWDAAGAWADGDLLLSPRSWLTTRAGMTGVDASRLVATARLAHGNDATGAALASGRVKVAHVEQLARVVVHERAKLYPEHERTLIDAASELLPDDFGVVVRRWRALADDQLDHGKPDDALADRRLHTSTTFQSRVRVDGMLDPDSGSILLAAIEAAMAADPDTPHDPRTPAQRRADALVDICRAYIGRDGAPSAAEVLAVIDVGTYYGAATDPGTARSDISGVGPVQPEVIHRMACDCVMRRVIVDANGEILDVGRRVRTATPAQRRAVIVRDQHCQFACCRRPPRWCEVHHAVPFDDGGPTDLHNLVLLCRRHHTLVHQGGWHLERVDGAWVSVRPDGTRVHDPPGPMSA